MLSQEIIISTNQSKDEDQIIQLLVEGFNGWPHFDLDCSPKDHWIWKFIENPQRKGYATLAKIDNKIIGCDHMLANRIQIGDGIYECKQWVDSVIHKDYRGQGIYSRIRNFDEERIKLTPYEKSFDYSASSNPIIIKKEEKMGTEQLPYPFLRLIRVVDIGAHLRNHELPRKIFLESAHTVTKGFTEFGNLMNKKPSQKSNIKLVDIKSFDEQIEPFWDELRKYYSLILERSVQYLNWRYCDHRGGNYIIRQAEEDGKIIGYIVLRVNCHDKNYPTGYIVDLSVLPGRDDCAFALVADAMRYFDELKINIVSYLIVKGHPYQKLLTQFGFLDSRNNVYLGLTGHNIEEAKNIHNYPPNKVLFQFGDFDWI